MTPIISDSPAHSTGTNVLWEKPTFELDVSTQQVSLEWIQSLPPELKDAALFRFCKTVEARATLVESFTLNQVLYRTISGNSFTESAESVAVRTGCDRKTILKGLNQAVSQNILSENKRPGTSTEYSFKPVEEWLSEPVVHIKDIRIKKVVEFPLTQECTQPQLDEGDGVVRSTDDPETDPNTVVVSLKDLEETTTEVSVPVGDRAKSTHWKYVGQGIPRIYVPPELDSDTGMKIESIHSATKEPRQFIIKNAVDLLYNKMNRIPSLMEEERKPAPFTALTAVNSAIGTQSTIPDHVMQALKEAGIHLNIGVAERLWLKYSESFNDAIAYTVVQDEAGKIKQTKSGFFRKSLEDGWSFNSSLSQNEECKQVSTRSLTTEQQQWYEWACATGVCDGKPVADLASSWNGELGVFVFVPAPNPALSPWVIKPISVAMREFPIA